MARKSRARRAALHGPAGASFVRGASMRDFSVPTRSAAVAANGMVATSAPMASLAGLDVLRAGGNAMDAAIAAVAMQSVVEPQSTGIGGDCFVLYSKKGAPPVALNGSGRTPAAANVEWYLERQINQIHTQTAHAVTVPGAVDACVCSIRSTAQSRSRNCSNRPPAPPRTAIA